MRSVGLRELVPWWGRIGAKLALSRLPVPYDLWRRLSLFRHGLMDQGEYAWQVFREHFERAGLAGKTGFSALELGPGDSLLSALSARAHGATRMVLVDAGDFATQDLQPYRAMARLLNERGLPVPSADGWATLDDVLRDCGATYETRGLESLRSLPSASLDFIWSQAVLEHIRRDEFAATMLELRRVLAPGGVASHRVDLRDHLGGALNNLRFSARRWEAPGFAARSGFYTNRIRYSEMLAMFREAGFDAEVVRVERWDELPTPLQRMDSAYRALPRDELLVSGFDVLLRPGGSP